MLDAERVAVGVTRAKLTSAMGVDDNKEEDADDDLAVLVALE